MFEMLVLGLVLFCVEGQTTDCPLPGSTGAHLLLVNATSTGPGCGAKCKTCAGDEIDLHRPVLAVPRAAVLAASFGNILDPAVLPCESFADPQVNVESFACWPLDEKKLTVTLVEPAQGPGIQPNGTGIGEHPGLGSAKGFRWVAPTKLFDPHYTDFRQDLGPGGSQPAIAWVDLPDFGDLEAALLGHTSAGGGIVYTLWRDGAGHGLNEQRALAEGVVWNTRVKGTGRIRFEAGSGEFVELKPGSRATLANLPDYLFDGWHFGGWSREILKHFRLYYNLFKAPASHSGCGAPSFVSGAPSVLARFPLEEWLRGGRNLDQPLGIASWRQIHQFFDGRGEITILDSNQTALCPPSKFP